MQPLRLGYQTIRTKSPVSHHSSVASKHQLQGQHYSCEWMVLSVATGENLARYMYRRFGLSAAQLRQSLKRYAELEQNAVELVKSQRKRVSGCKGCTLS